jgi:hypothetical protein
LSSNSCQYDRPSPGAWIPATLSDSNVDVELQPGNVIEAPHLGAALSQARDSQPGLEVQYNNFPIAVDVHPANYSAPFQLSKEQFHANNNYYQQALDTTKAEANTELEAARQARHRMKWIAVGVAVLAIIVVAAVAGAAVGTRNADASKAAPAVSSRPSSSDGGGGPNTAASAATQIRPNSGLAASGNFWGTDYSIRLFFQGPDDKLRYMVYQTNFGTWTAVQETVTRSAALSGSPLGASTIFFGSGAVVCPQRPWSRSHRARWSKLTISGQPSRSPNRILLRL